MTNCIELEEHGIDHLSASSINLYITNPCQWIVRYLYGVKWQGNPATARGTSVDNGIGYYLTSQSMKKPYTKEQCISKANQDYDKLIEHQKENQDSVDNDKVRKEKDALPKYLETAIDFYSELMDPNKPFEYQKEIELQIEGIKITGFLDLLCEGEGTVRDIKTVSRMPVSLPSSVKRQLSIYAMATDKTPIADYVCVTKTKAEVKPIVVSDVDEYFEQVVRACKSIKNLLSYSNDKQQIADLFYPDLDHWMFTDHEREAARKIWS